MGLTSCGTPDHRLNAISECPGGTLWHTMARKEHFSLRLSPETVRRIVRRSELSGRPKTALAEQFLQECLRMAEHPGIVFRDGSAGPRASLAGHRLDVCEIAETVLTKYGH